MPVQTLERQMSFYIRYHRDARNKLTHFVGGGIRWHSIQLS